MLEIVTEEERKREDGKSMRQRKRKEQEDMNR